MISAFDFRATKIARQLALVEPDGLGTLVYVHRRDPGTDRVVGSVGEARHGFERADGEAALGQGRDLGPGIHYAAALTTGCRARPPDVVSTEPSCASRCFWSVYTRKGRKNFPLTLGHEGNR
jgi:hypothetical protein